MTASGLSPQRLLQDRSVLRLVQIALAEDVGTGDITSEGTIPEAIEGSGVITLRDGGVLCGSSIADLVASEVDRQLRIDWHVSEGTHSPIPRAVGTISGSLRSMLTAERTILNFMQRMSGIANITRRFVEAVLGTNARIVDTRKTIPGWRLLDKYSVAIGGGTNHRFGLYDMVMIKDNHIAAAGSITQAVRALCASMSDHPISLRKIEVETASLDEVEEAVRCPEVGRIMFDNFTVKDVRRGVEIVDGRMETEASGGITLDSVRSFAGTGVDYISVGAITHSVCAADIALDIATVT